MDVFQNLFNIANQKKLANIPAKDAYGMPYERAEQMLYATEDPSIRYHGGFRPLPIDDYRLPMELREKDRDLYLEGEGFLAGQGGTRFNRSTFADRLGKAFRGEL